MGCLYGIRRRPILPGRRQPGTFGAEKLNFCVRDGNRWDLLAIITGNSGSRVPVASLCFFARSSPSCFRLTSLRSPSACSFLRVPFVPSKPHTGMLSSILEIFFGLSTWLDIRFLDQALDLLVLATFHITAFTAPTYQPCRLQGVLLAFAMGYLFLRGASRLDAFSVYPVRTSLPCYAVGTTTVAPEVRPLRSSRTRSSSSHVSYAHDG